MFSILFFVGLFGFITMGVLSFGHGLGHRAGSVRHAGRLGTHGSTATAKLAAHHGPAVKVGTVKASGAKAAQGAKGNSNAKSSGDTSGSAGLAAFNVFITVFNPLDIFAICLAIGGAGLIAQDEHIAPNLAIAISIAFGLFFNFAIIRPVMHFAMQFASKPSDGLEGLIANEVTAIGRFDDQGKGIVQVQLDGQLSRVLAVLDSPEKPMHDDVRSGDKLIVVEVDSKKSRVVVSKVMGGH